MRNLSGLTLILCFTVAQLAFNSSAWATPLFTSPNLTKDFHGLDSARLPGGYQIWKDNNPLDSHNTGIRFYYASGLFVGEGAEAEDQPANPPSQSISPLTISAPDPSTMALLGLGLICLGLARRKHQKHPDNEKKAS